MLTRFRLPLISLFLLCACQQNDDATPEELRAFIAANPVLAKRADEKEKILKIFADSMPAQFDTIRRGIIFLVETELAKLGYHRGPFMAKSTPGLRNAIREYERVRGLPVTGDPLSDPLLYALERDVFVANKGLNVPYKSVYARYGGLTASAGGTWTFDGMPRNEYQVVQIECARSTWTCTEAIASFRSEFTPSMNVVMRTWYISSWTESQLDALADVPCARQQLSVSFIQETAVKRVTRTDACYDPQYTPRLVTLQSGGDVSDRARNERVDLHTRVMSIAPEAREFLRAAANGIGR